MEGIHNDDAELDKLQPCPPPGAKGRNRWKPNVEIKGPIGLLINSIHKMQATIAFEGGQITIRQHREQDIDIKNCPWQHLKPLVEDACKRTRDRSTAVQRSLLKGNDLEIDYELLKQTIESHDEDGKRWIRHHLNLGIWTDSKLAIFEKVFLKKCRYCQHPKGDQVHLTLECPHFKDQRYEGDEQLQEVKLETLPKALQLGLPTVNEAMDSQYLWPRQDAIRKGEYQQGTASRAQLQAAGRGLLQGLLRQGGEGENVRQIMGRCRKNGKMHEDIPMPQRCEEEPPEVPNVFTDGSLKLPDAAFLSFGGLGIWHVERDLAEKPLHIFEDEFGLNKVEEEGVAIYAPMAGIKNSSTRTEIAAGIMGLYSPGAIHQASDSKGYVLRANQILQGNPRKRKKRRPWGLTKDGDLWDLFEKASEAKGKKAVKIAWTKGHANHTHIDKGITNEYNMKHNNKADATADKGVTKGFGEGLIQLATFFYKQRQEIGKLAKRIQAAIIRVLRAEHEERAKEEEKERKKIHILHGRRGLRQLIPPVGTLSSLTLNVTPFKVKIDRPRYSQINASEADFIFRVFAFIKQSFWIPTTDVEIGSSWVELYATFYILGGQSNFVLSQGPDPKAIHQRSTARLPNTSDNLHATQMQFLEGLRNFTRVFKWVVMHCCQPQYRFLLQPARVGVARLEAYNIKNHVPCIKAERETKGRLGLLLHKAMASLTAPFNKK